MAFPSSFQERVQEMEDTRQLLLQRLQAEKELQERKILQLSKQQETLAKVKQRCLALKQKDAELCVKVMEKEEEMRAADKSLMEIQIKRWFAIVSLHCIVFLLSWPFPIFCFISLLQSDLNELEHRQCQRREYYEQKRSMMASHQGKLQDNVSDLKAEVKNLGKHVLQLEADLSGTQGTSSVISRLDAEIGAEEWRKIDILAQINALEAQINKNCIIKMGLEQRIEQARKEADGKKKTAEKQTLEILELQSENQSLENRVLEAIQLRGQRKRFGFGKHFRNKA